MKQVFTFITLSLLFLFVGCSFKAKPEHNHTFSDSWEYNDEYHWHKAECHPKVTDTKMPHQYEEDWTVSQKPTREEEGLEERFCSECSYSQKRTIDKLTYIGSKTPDSSKAIGDIIFKDGSITSYSEELELTEVEKENIVGIVMTVNEDGTSGLIVGVNFGERIAFSKQNITYKAAELKTTSTLKSGEYTFTDDIDGSDNLDIFKSLDPNAANDLATYYPALYYAYSYGTENGFTDEYADGWYLPAQKELYDICKNFALFEDIRYKTFDTKMSFTQDRSRTNPGGTDYCYRYYLLSSNLSQLNLSSGVSTSVNVINFKYIDSKKAYQNIPTSYSEITKGSSYTSTGGGSNGYVYTTNYTYTMAVHKF